jgi:C4-dicarboxylate transporter DctM subunit
MLTGLVLFGLFFVFILLEFPIALCLGLSSVLTLIIFNLMPLDTVPFVAQQMFSAADSFSLLAIPLFIITGTLLGRSGISQRLINLANALVGRWKIGLAMVAIIVSIFFAGISGSGPADTAALGLILIPALVTRGYPKDFSAALMAAGGGIGIIIPPSIALIVYGVVADASVSQLFIAGIIPGMMVGLSIAAYCYWKFRKDENIQPEENTIPLGKAFKEAVWGLMAPVVILGGIYSGIFTPTEAAAVAVAYALLVDRFIYKELSWKQVREIFNQSGVTSASVLFIIACASLFAWILNSQGIASGIAATLLEYVGNKYVLLLIINIILLIAGCFMDAISIFYILLPIFMPICYHFGINPVHFGIIMTVNLAVGQITPPVGVNLFVASSISKVPVKELAKSVFPLIMAETAVLLLITYIPALSTWLPQLLGVK